MNQGLTTFIRLGTERNPQGTYQNSIIGRTVNWNGFDHSFLSFIYKGASRNRSGDNMESELMLATNHIVMNLANSAVTNKWAIMVDTVSMHPETFATGALLGREIWQITSFSYDPETLVIRLSSAIDAVGGTAPTRTLTEALVGQLPVSSQIRNV
jgi:hypothetical protein